MGKDADSQFQNELNRVSGLKDDYMFTYDRLTLQNRKHDYAATRALLL